MGSYLGTTATPATSTEATTAGDMRLLSQLESFQIEWPKSMNRHYIPNDKLEDLITSSNVKKELRSIYPSMNSQDIHRYTTIICDNGEAKKLFAILLATKKSSIHAFIDAEIRDKDLAFERGYIPKSPQDSRYFEPFVLCPKGHSRRCKLSTHISCGISAMSCWSHTDISSLCAKQWWAQAPIFRKSNDNQIPHLELNDNIIMPYIKDFEFNTGEWKPRQGGKLSHPSLPSF